MFTTFPIHPHIKNFNTQLEDVILTDDGFLGFEAVRADNPDVGDR